ncbi:hypothetical protein [Caulobacter sp. 1776]|uniref:hypothetical protein n=1 Tax=Caulobacter sp. 1776 TaxID=3156420 RepID=UPI00339928FA
MNLDDIDQLLDINAKEAAEKGDEGLLPGLIQLSADTYCRVSTLASGMACTKILDGIRYRGVKVSVARAFEDKVLNRSEAGERGEPFFDLEAKT